MSVLELSLVFSFFLLSIAKETTKVLRMKYYSVSSILVELLFSVSVTHFVVVVVVVVLKDNRENSSRLQSTTSQCNYYMS